jgi:arylamine N-acetyltransferase
VIQPGLNHLAFVVHDLGEVPWFVDAGLGDAIYDPLPLVPGVYAQGPFRYELTPAADRDGWRFTHDVNGSFAAMEFESAAATLADFADAHLYWSTSPESTFTQFLTAQVRTASKFEGIRGLTVITADAQGRHSAELPDFADWLGYLTGLGLAAEPLTRMWEPTVAHHHEWVTLS